MPNAAAAVAEAAPPPKGKKTLIIIAAVVLVIALGGAAAMLLLKKKPAEDEGEEGAANARPAKSAVKDAKAVPVFVPLDPFVVNLADKEAERYAQIGITLEITDTKLGDRIKAFMPAIRHVVLMVLAEKTAAQLIERAGKEKLARQVQRETSRVLGAEVEDEEEETEHAAGGKKDGKEARQRKKRAPVELPISAVHFSSFIVQ